MVRDDVVVHEVKWVNI